MKSWFRVLLGLGFSSFFLWLALRGIDWAELRSVLDTVRWQYAPLALLVWSLSLTVRSLRWRALLEYRATIKSAFHIFNICTFINNTIPFRVGDFTRAYLIGRDPGNRVSSWSALTTIVTERLADILAMVLLLMIVLLLLPVNRIVVGSVLIMGAAAIIGFCILLILASHIKLAHTMLFHILRFVPGLERLKPAAKLDKLLEGLQPLTTKRGLIRVILWTILVWTITLGETLTLSLLFGDMARTTAVYAGLALAIVTASLSVTVPFTMANVGPFEAATVFALKTGGVAQETALAFAILWHVGAILNSALWGTIGFLALQISPKQMRHQVPGSAPMLSLDQDKEPPLTEI